MVQIRTSFAVGLMLLSLNAVFADDRNEPAAEEAAPVPPTTAEIDAAITRGVDFLVASQNKNGSWGSATRTKDLDIYAPVPGAHDAFRGATTSLCISALIEARDPRPEAAQALARAEEWLIQNLPEVRRATPDALYNVWTHTYSIQALVRMHKEAEGNEARQSTIANLIEQQFDLLSRYESVDGGWGYYDFKAETKQPTTDSISFVNAAALVAMYEAKEAGFEPPMRVVNRAIAATLRQRLPDFSYLYGEYLHWQPRRGINRPGGSLGRSQACNIALRYWGDKKVTDAVLEEWLERLIDRNGWLDIGRKRPIPHESWFQVAGYFYYFGHYYAAYCIQALPADRQPHHKQRLATVILGHQEKDGSWWDYPLYNYHQPYGTSYAIMTLLKCR